MPCYCEPPSQLELEMGRLRGFMREIGGKSSGLQEMTQILCKWCKNNDPHTKSLELQIWWRDHQAADERHEREQKEQKRLRQVRKEALLKLTIEERKALGVW